MEIVRGGAPQNAIAHCSHASGQSEPFFARSRLGMDEEYG